MGVQVAWNTHPPQAPAIPTRDEAETEAMLQRITVLYREAHELERAYMPVKPLHEHGAFDDIEAARWQISRARDALAGIAALMQPDSRGADEQLNMAHRSDAYAIFDFFAETMREPLEVVDSAAYRLKSALRTGQP